MKVNFPLSPVTSGAEVDDDFRSECLPGGVPQQHGISAQSVSRVSTASPELSPLLRTVYTGGGKLKIF